MFNLDYGQDEVDESAFKGSNPSKIPAQPSETTERSYTLLVQQTDNTYG